MEGNFGKTSFNRWKQYYKQSLLWHYGKQNAYDRGPEHIQMLYMDFWQYCLK